MTDFDNLPDARDTSPQVETKRVTPPVRTTPVPEGTGGTGELDYLTGRFNRGVAVARGDDWIPPMGTAPNRLTELLGSGIEGVAAHPLQSIGSVPTVFGASVLNDLFPNASPNARVAMDALYGWLGPSGLARIASAPIRMLGSHGNLLTSLLHSGQTIGNTLHSLVPSGAGWIRSGARTAIGATIGEEEPPSDTSQLHGWTGQVGP